MSKHTPSPWSVKSADWDSEGDVRYTLNGIKHFSAPHKNLIEAAPDLLEALQLLFGDDALQSVCVHAGGDAFGRIKGTWGHEAEKKARAAIAKATGETT